MDMGEVIQAMVEKEKQEEFAQKSIRTLGEVILLLERQPPSNVVKLDFANCNPECLISYRGYYSDLCLDYDLNIDEMTVEQLLQKFKDAVGQVFIGFKGGEFTMSTKTLVWVAPYSECGRMLTDIIEKDGVTIVCTQEDED